ncbi:MAG: hypothetical protein E6J35_08375 [Chloroflexi bacterium]|nr:MAG: hypothetical protein E6J35_08375 [Chloroflexota bacterium]
MKDERAGRGHDHRKGAGRASDPVGFETEKLRRRWPDHPGHQDEPQHALAIAEHQQRGHQDDDLQVRAPQRAAALHERAASCGIRGAVVEIPRRHCDEEQGDRQARLLAVLLARAVELCEHERQPCEAAARCAQRDLGTHTQEIRDAEDDHMDRDEQHDVEVRALHRGHWPVLRRG